MTREEMREKVARALAETQGEIVNDAWRFYLDDADAAIAIIRGETLEEAARVVWVDRVKDPYKDGDYGWNAAMEAAAAAIRALKEKGDE